MRHVAKRNPSRGRIRSQAGSRRKERSRRPRSNAAASIAAPPSRIVPFRIDSDETLSDLKSLCKEHPRLGKVLQLAVSRRPVRGYPDQRLAKFGAPVKVGRRVVEPGDFVVFDQDGPIGTMTREERNCFRLGAA